MSFWTLDDLTALAGKEFDYEEFNGLLFAALIRGDKATSQDKNLNSWPAQFIYKHRALSKYPKGAQLIKSGLRRLPIGQ